MYGRGSFFLICSWLVMLWEVTGCRRADPVRHYEAVDVSLFMACLAELILLFLSFHGIVYAESHLISLVVGKAQSSIPFDSATKIQLKGVATKKKGIFIMIPSNLNYNVATSL